MNILITICARGGSKGVQGKNSRLLAGKPLIAHSIGQARDWKRAKKVLVSTDSPAIASIARDFGAEVPFLRPDELARDDSDKLLVIQHACQEAEKAFQTKFDIIVDLDATSPFRTKEDLENCYQLFVKKKPLTLFSVVRAHKNPYFNMVEVNQDGYATLSKPLSRKICRRQDAPLVYAMNASIYFFDRDYLINPKTVSPFSERTVPYVMDDISGFDIDREIDFKFAEFLIQEGLFQL